MCGQLLCYMSTTKIGDMVSIDQILKRIVVRLPVGHNIHYTTKRIGWCVGHLYGCCSIFTVSPSKPPFWIRQQLSLGT